VNLTVFMNLTVNSTQKKKLITFFFFLIKTPALNTESNKNPKNPKNSNPNSNPNSQDDDHLHSLPALLPEPAHGYYPGSRQAVQLRPGRGGQLH